jgi:hypothetical protein
MAVPASRIWVVNRVVDQSARKREASEPNPPPPLMEGGASDAFLNSEEAVEGCIASWKW